MRVLALAAFAAAYLVLPGAVSAHVTANPNEASADSYFRTALRVGHGCEGSSTIAVRVKLPDGITSARPEMKPGWAIDIKMRKLDKPIDAGHGRMISEVVDEIAWRGGPLPDAYFAEFGLSLKLPNTPNATLYFPLVQECEKGAHRWIEIPAAGQGWNDLKEPAPFVRVGPKRGGH